MLSPYSTSLLKRCSHEENISEFIDRITIQEEYEGGSAEDERVGPNNMESAVSKYVVRLLKKTHDYKLTVLNAMHIDDPPVHSLYDLLSIFRTTDRFGARDKAVSDKWKRTTDKKLIQELTDEKKSSKQCNFEEYTRCQEILRVLFSDATLVNDLATEYGVDAEGSLRRVDPLLAEAITRLRPVPHRRIAMIYDLATSRDVGVQSYMNTLLNRTDPVDAYVLSALHRSCRVMSYAADTPMSNERFQKIIYCDTTATRLLHEVHAESLQKQRDRSELVLSIAMRAIMDVGAAVCNRSLRKYTPLICDLMNFKNTYRGSVEATEVVPAVEDDWPNVLKAMWNRFIHLVKICELKDKHLSITGCMLSSSNGNSNVVDTFVKPHRDGSTFLFSYDYKMGHLVALENYVPEKDTLDVTKWHVVECEPESFNCSLDDCGVHPMYVLMKSGVLNCCIQHESSFYANTNSRGWEWSMDPLNINERCIATACRLLCCMDVFVNPMFDLCDKVGYTNDNFSIPQFKLMPPRYGTDPVMQLFRNIPGAVARSPTTTMLYDESLKNIYSNKFPVTTLDLWLAAFMPNADFDKGRITYDQFKWYVNYVARALAKAYEPPPRSHVKVIGEYDRVTDSVPAIGFVHAMLHYGPSDRTDPDSEIQYKLFLETVVTGAFWFPYKTSQMSAGIKECMEYAHKVKASLDNGDGDDVGNTDIRVPYCKKDEGGNVERKEEEEEDITRREPECAQKIRTATTLLRINPEEQRIALVTRHATQFASAFPLVMEK